MKTHTFIYGDDYEVYFKYALGNSGDYENPPEEHEVEILKVYDMIEDKPLDEVSDAHIWWAAEHEAYDLINEGL